MTVALPVDHVVPEVLAALRLGTALTVSSPPGSGKTTRLPIAISREFGGGVVVLEPRRIAARAAARRVASEIGSELGAEVGYEVRDDRRVSRATQLRFVTEGVLVRRIVEDPFLEGVRVVVLDEFHERHVETDLALSMLREVRDTVRPELKIVVMSATLEIDPVREFLHPCAHVDADGGLYEVEIEHVDAARTEALEARIKMAVARALDETPGDVLAFVPGMAEIRRAQRELESLARSRDLVVLPLHGQLDAAAQDAALAPCSKRKVVIATNVAESSITIDGVTAVVDSGLARVLRFDVARGLDALRVETISRASAQQRAGRAGRTGPGRCYRLWSRAEERGMPAFDLAEIRRVDLAGPCLSVRAFSGRDPAAFGWFEAPDPVALASASEVLAALGAVDAAGQLTERGRQMLRLPVHPRLGRMLVEARRRDCTIQVATVAAILNERELSRSLGLDLHDHVEALERCEASGFRRRAAIDTGAARMVARTRDRLVRTLRGARDVGDDADVGRCVLAAFPDRVGRCERPGEGQLSSGRGFSIDDPAFRPGDLLVALRVDDRDGQSRSRVRLALRIERGWLEQVVGDQLVTEQVAEFAPGAGKAVMVSRTRFRALVLEEQRGGNADAAAIEALLAETVRSDPFRYLGDRKQQRGLRSFLARVRWLRGVRPDLDLPEFDDAAIGEALAMLAPGKKDLRAFRDAPLLDLLESQLTREQRARLASDAPVRIRVGRGKDLRIDYEPEPPHIAARLQEFFGVATTPRIGGGKVPLQLQLLAPNMRPVQITDDLESFWRNIYPRVRSELRNRYPKHAWPENPGT